MVATGCRGRRRGRETAERGRSGGSAAEHCRQAGAGDGQFARGNGKVKRRAAMKRRLRRRRAYCAWLLVWYYMWTGQARKRIDREQIANKATKVARVRRHAQRSVHLLRLPTQTALWSDSEPLSIQCVEGRFDEVLVLEHIRGSKVVQESRAHTSCQPVISKVAVE
eukprot:390984-Prorocentrum_minimum.AAC.2